MPTIELTAADGHRLAAYVAQPAGTPRGALLVLQEIFGVNSHIRAVADGFAADGYLAIAPALFDRSERGVELGVFGAPSYVIDGEIFWGQDRLDFVERRLAEG